MNIPILDEIMAALEDVNETDIHRSARNLNEPSKNEHRIGEANKTEAQRVWALGDKYRGEYARLRTRAEYEASSYEEKKTLELLAARFDTLADLCREIFWAQVRDELGSDAHLEESMGVRKDYVIVRVAQPLNPLVKMFGAQFPMEPPE